MGSEHDSLDVIYLVCVFQQIIIFFSSHNGFNWPWNINNSGLQTFVQSNSSGKLKMDYCIAMLGQLMGPIKLVYSLFNLILITLNYVVSGHFPHDFSIVSQWCLIVDGHRWCNCQISRVLPLCSSPIERRSGRGMDDCGWGRWVRVSLISLGSWNSYQFD